MFRATDEGNTNLNPDFEYKFCFGNFNGDTTKSFIKVSGNIQTLLDKTGKRKDVPNGAFYGLFFGIDYLLYDASELKLPALKIEGDAYAQMFAGSAGLIRPPKELPALLLGYNCYYYMFVLCNLEYLPKIPKNAKLKEYVNELGDGSISIWLGQMRQMLPYETYYSSEMLTYDGEPFTIPDDCYNKYFEMLEKYEAYPETSIEYLFNTDAIDGINLNATAEQVIHYIEEQFMICSAPSEEEGGMYIYCSDATLYITYANEIFTIEILEKEI